MMKALLSLVLLTSGQHSAVGAFTVFSPSHQTVQRSSSSSSTLQAKVKKTKTKNKSGAGTGGGFGVAATTKSKKATGPKDDYAAFPELEPGVKDTLVAAANPTEASAADLPTEIYERLAQIYGFRSFNYLAGVSDDNETEEGAAMSFEDLLSSGAKDEEKAPSADFSDLLKPTSPLGGDLNSLLASATGSDDDATSDDQQQQESMKDLPISKLLPFDKFKVLHVDPLVISVENFFTDDECDRYIDFSERPPKNFDSPLMSRSKTVGKDANAESQRTSTTWYHHYKGVPELMTKAARLFGLDGINHFEEPQTVRYRKGEKFTWHLDALAPGGDAIEKAGQRTATMLVYLTDLKEDEGGATMFRDLGVDGTPLKVRPQKGSALVFFPAAAGIPNAPLDIRTLHCGEAVAEDASTDKWIAQLWLRETSYKPTAPPGNTHTAAFEAIEEFCSEAVQVD